ncbi:uncharacterized protein K489DRAFT_374104 [Dissoconium aciculare CBS 342.82]|uniref:Uncharacterized protein n=1 Tax=Dissoconium aciculare CBS 342.82 TaxID=1314786 RepID=A0A6J3LSH3_9PEZI|nr:uncharacterized protein K489DRAFT_374104 [Dissoconium aciculare CBS 342.82]KAF1818750.1 hypothetical protein K489DRAFT_374104 [Dissoconium aciculare CBS 342.82]
MMKKILSIFQPWPARSSVVCLYFVVVGTAYVHVHDRRVVSNPSSPDHDPDPEPLFPLPSSLFLPHSHLYRESRQEHTLSVMIDHEKRGDPGEERLAKPEPMRSWLRIRAPSSINHVLVFESPHTTSYGSYPTPTTIPTDSALLIQSPVSITTCIHCHRLVNTATATSTATATVFFTTASPSPLTGISSFLSFATTTAITTLTSPASVYLLTSDIDLPLDPHTAFCESLSCWTSPV